jgi:phosphoglycolate phosphatase
MQECMEALFPDVSPGHYAGFIEVYRRHFQEQARTPVSLFPDAKRVLKSLGSAGYTIAIATGKSRRGLDRELHESGLVGIVSASRCADEAPSKPHPQMLEDVLELTLTAPRGALMIGDTTYDMQMARDAGVDRIAVSYGTHETRRLLEFSPLKVIDSLAALEIWLFNGALAK